MKQLKLFVMACFAIVLASCGGKKSSGENEKIVLTPETTHIKGDLGDYFEVVDKEYTVTEDFGDLVSIEVMRTDIAYAFDLKGVEPYGTYGKGVTGNAGFGIEILDEDGNVIEKATATAGGLGGMYSSDDMKEALKLKAGETGTVRWSFHFGSDQKPAKFRLTSAYEEVDSSDEATEVSEIEDTEESDEIFNEIFSDTDTPDWNELLDSYEQYVDKYISYAKKAAKGDMSALTEYPSLMQKAEEFSKKMADAQNDMSASQWARYMKITNKMTNAIQELR